MDLEARNHDRSAMHRWGAVGITQLLQFPVPSAENRGLALRPCGHTAHYQGVRSKSVLTAVRPGGSLASYYFVLHCHNGRFPVDVELGLENMELSSGRTAACRRR